MMKLKYYALSTALVMTLALTGCSANRVNDSAAPDAPSNSVTPGNGVQNSAGVDNDIRNSAGIDYGNDAMQGGGAGGTNDLNNDGHPDGSAGVTGNGSGSTGAGTSRAANDVGRAAGDLARGAGDVVRDAGNAIGNAANDVGNAMR